MICSGKRIFGRNKTGLCRQVHSHVAHVSGTTPTQDETSSSRTGVTGSPGRTGTYILSKVVFGSVSGPK
jgi:hypothetical protein